MKRPNKNDWSGMEGDIGYSDEQDCYINQLEQENKKLKKSKTIHIKERMKLSNELQDLKETIKRVEDSLMSDEEITKFCDNSQHWVYIAEKTKAIKIQRDLIKKALCSQPKLIYTCMHTFTQVSQEWQSCSQCGMIRPLRHNDYNNTLK